MKTIISVIFFLLLTTISNQALAHKSTGVLEKECAVNNFQSCASLGLNFDIGLGVRQDKSKSLVLYEKACNGGYAHGCFSSGLTYEIGRGVPQDKLKALQLYGKACNLKEKKGCEQYARLINQGVQ